MLKDQFIHWASLKPNGEKLGAVTCFFISLMANWSRCSVWPRDLSLKPRSKDLLERKNMSWPALQSKYRGVNTGGWCPASDALCQRGCEKIKVLPGHALEMLREEAQVKPQHILWEIPEPGGVFKGVDVHGPGSMEMLCLVSSLGCWGTQKLGIHWGVSSGPKIINVFLDS